jgi:hypothetical protein
MVILQKLFFLSVFPKVENLCLSTGTCSRPFVINNFNPTINVRWYFRQLYLRTTTLTQLSMKWMWFWNFLTLTRKYSILFSDNTFVLYLCIHWRQCDVRNGHPKMEDIQVRINIMVFGKIMDYLSVFHVSIDVS